MRFPSRRGVSVPEFAISISRSIAGLSCALIWRSFRALTFLLWTPGWPRLDAEAPPCAEALYAFGVPRKPNSRPACGAASRADRWTFRGKSQIGLAGTRTQNQRLKRAIVYIYKRLVTSKLRKRCFLLLRLLLPPAEKVVPAKDLSLLSYIWSAHQTYRLLDVGVM